VFSGAFSSVGRARFHKNQLRVTWDQCDSAPPFQALSQIRAWIVIQGKSMSLRKLLYWRLAADQFWSLQLICLTWLQLGFVSLSIFWWLNHGSFESLRQFRRRNLFLPLNNSLDENAPHRSHTTWKITFVEACSSHCTLRRKSSWPNLD